MKIKKLILSIILVIVIVVVIAIGGIILFLDSLVANGIRKFGTEATGTEVTLGSARISLTGGNVALNSLAIANPKGYQKPAAFGFGRFYVDVDLGTVTSDKIVIETIKIDGIKIDFEPNLTGSNLTDIKNNIMKYVKGSKKAAEQKPVEKKEEPTGETGEKKPEKKVVIRKLLITNGEVSISSKTLGQSVTVPLADIEMTDIGEDKDRTASETVMIIYGEIMNAVAKAASSTGLKDLNLDGLTKGSLDTATKTVEDVGNTVKDSLKSLKKSIFD
jgi:hypothetical protein